MKNNNEMSRREIEARLAFMKNVQAATDDQDVYIQLEEQIRFYESALANV